MQRFSGQPWRLAGAVVGWLGFSFCFTLLYLSAGVVMGLGGFCASGGAYVIATECPDSVVAFTPLSIVGGLVIVGVSVYLARGFGTPLAAWAWPILFCGLGVQFLLSALSGDPTGIFIAVVFIVMGLVPLVIAFRADWRPVLVGSTALNGHPFGDTSAASRLAAPFGREDDREPIAPTATDWLVSLSITILGSALGIYLALATFSAVANSGPQ
ncbi:MAG: hypothetical protein ABIR17_08225 [Pseudolysinimonas sp.]|uniref:hypothetical protein n=1 Tax=Pseudolysinimonas sp. TaxID=2680009 RepID=UPI003264C2BC